MADKLIDRPLTRFTRNAEKFPNALDRVRYFNGLAFSQDGRYLAAAEGLRVHGLLPYLSQEHAASVWEVADVRQLMRFQVDGAVTSVAFAPDMTYLAAGAQDNTGRAWNLQRKEEVLRVTHEHWVNAVAIGPEGRRLATGSTDGTASVWDLPGGQELWRAAVGSTIEHVIFSPDGRFLVTGTRSGTIDLWDIESQRGGATVQHDPAIWTSVLSPGRRSCRAFLLRRLLARRLLRR